MFLSFSERNSDSGPIKCPNLRGSASEAVVCVLHFHRFWGSSIVCIFEVLPLEKCISHQAKCSFYPNDSWSLNVPHVHFCCFTCEKWHSFALWDPPLQIFFRQAQYAVPLCLLPCADLEMTPQTKKPLKPLVALTGGILMTTSLFSPLMSTKLKRTCIFSLSRTVNAIPPLYRTRHKMAPSFDASDGGWLNNTTTSARRSEILASSKEK